MIACVCMFEIVHIGTCIQNDRGKRQLDWGEARKKIERIIEIFQVKKVDIRTSAATGEQESESGIILILNFVGGIS